MDTSLPLSADKRAQMAQAVKNWKLAGPLLEQFQREELRAMTDEEHRRSFEMLVDLVSPVGRHRIPTGFVEQQRLFQKLLK